MENKRNFECTDMDWMSKKLAIFIAKLFVSDKRNSLLSGRSIKPHPMLHEACEAFLDLMVLAGACGILAFIILLGK